MVLMTCANALIWNELVETKVYLSNNINFFYPLLSSGYFSPGAWYSDHFDTVTAIDNTRSFKCTDQVLAGWNNSRISIIWFVLVFSKLILSGTLTHWSAKRLPY
ncbi:hypothetical protein ACFSW8_05110 [Rubritalea tangerina]|uniref:Uncharacterized protein n=2 Tax=Rubritalea tangerina TaxID=430798 RepID=A0ABW4Z8H4_9BACT